MYTYLVFAGDSTRGESVVYGTVNPSTCNASSRQDLTIGDRRSRRWNEEFRKHQRLCYLLSHVAEVFAPSTVHQNRITVTIGALQWARQSRSRLAVGRVSLIHRRLTSVVQVPTRYSGAMSDLKSRSLTARLLQRLNAIILYCQAKRWSLLTPPRVTTRRGSLSFLAFRSRQLNAQTTWFPVLQQI